METWTRNGRMATTLALGAVFLLFIALAGNTAGDCLPIEPQNLCESDADCANLPMNGVEGRWECVGGLCELHGDIIEPPDSCQSDADCRPGQRCEVALDMDCCPPGALCLMDVPVCEGVCVPGPDPNECRSDADCGPNEICVTVCAMWDCASPEGADCARQPQECSSECVPDPDPNDCQSDADCRPGERCVIDWDQCWRSSEEPCAPGERCGEPCLGTCEPGPDPNECRSDADCGPNEMCVTVCPVWDCASPEGNDCVPPSEPCFSECVAVSPRECWSDADCGPGEICQFDPDDCPVCPPGQDCLDLYMACNGQCVPGPDPNGCQSDADCRPGEVCQFMCTGACPEQGPCPPVECFGQCVPETNPDECRSDEDCRAGEQCLVACAAPACGDGQLCPPPECFGQCVPRDEPECFTDEDCGPYAHCEIFPDFCAPGGGYDDPPCGYDESGDPTDPGCLPPEPWPCGGVCVPDPEPSDCGVDWDCPADQRCELGWDGFGRCVPIKECLSNADCPGDTFCDYGYWGCDNTLPCEDGDEARVALPCMGVCVEHPVFR